MLAYALHRRRLRRHGHVFAVIYGIFVTGLNFFMGYTGQVSFGQNAFAALGGYSSAILHRDYDWEPIAALAVGMALAGWSRSWSAIRRCGCSGHYLAMATFALGLIVYEIASSGR